MRKELVAFAMVALLSPVVVRAQEAAREDDERPAEGRRPLRVLDNPYDIASFYRSSSGGRGLYAPVDLYGSQRPLSGPYALAGYYRSRSQNYFGLQNPAQNPYAIAGYYQSHAGNDLRFWYGGYSGPVRSDRPGHRRYRSSIGENGDIFLMAPTVLAPLGALSAVYYLE